MALRLCQTLLTVFVAFEKFSYNEKAGIVLYFLLSSH